MHKGRAGRWRWRTGNRTRLFNIWNPQHFSGYLDCVICMRSWRKMSCLHLNQYIQYELHFLIQYLITDPITGLWHIPHVTLLPLSKIKENDGKPCGKYLNKLKYQARSEFIICSSFIEDGVKIVNWVKSMKGEWFLFLTRATTCGKNSVWTKQEVHNKSAAEIIMFMDETWEVLQQKILWGNGNQCMLSTR